MATLILQKREFERLIGYVVSALALLALFAVLFWSATGFAQTAVPSAPAPEAVPVSWLALVVAVLGAVLAWYSKSVRPTVDGKLTSIAADTTKPKLERTAAQVALDLEPLVLSAAGHVADDVEADGSDLHKLATDAGTDLIGTLDTGLLAEATKYFGDAGGSILNFVIGAIKNRVQATQTATVQAAAAAGAAAGTAAGATGAAAVKAINAGV